MSYAPYALVLLTMGLAATGCRKKSVPLKKLRCDFPAAAVQEMRQANGHYSKILPHRKEWMRLLNQKCWGWSKPLRWIIEVFSEFSQDELDVLCPKHPGLSKTGVQWAEAHLEPVCPGARTLIYSGGKMPSVAAVKKLWHSCRLVRYGLMTPTQFVANPHVGLMAVLIYRQLRDAEIEEPVARSLARLLLVGTRFLGNSKVGEMMYSKSTSDTFPTELEVVEVMISASSILVDNQPVLSIKEGRVAPIARTGRGFEILRQKLIDASRDHVAKRTSLKHELLLHVHKNTPYRLVAKVLHLARSVGFRLLQLAVVQTTTGQDAIIFLDLPKAP